MHIMSAASAARRSSAHLATLALTVCLGCGDDSGTRQQTAGEAPSPQAVKIYEEAAALSDTSVERALEGFRRAELIDPSFAAASYQVALLSTLLWRPTEARRAARAALDAKERLSAVERAGAEALASFVEGDLDAASRLLEPALERHRDDPGLNFIVGMIDIGDCGHFDPNRAVTHLERAIDGGLDAPSVRARLMEAYEMKGMQNWSLTRALDRHSVAPDDPESIAELGRARIFRGEYGDAIEAADEILRGGGDILARGLAPAFTLTGHHDQIAALYDPEAEVSNPPDANALAHLHAGVNAIWMGAFDEAAVHLERGPEYLSAPWQRSERALFHLLLARAQAMRGRLPEAASALEAAVQATGPQPILEYASGSLSLAAGRSSEADRVLDRLSREERRSRPGWTEPWRRLLAAEIAMARGAPTRAVDEAREAWSLGRPLAVNCIVRHADAFYLDALGRAWLAAGRPDEALQAFEQVRALGYRGYFQPDLAVLSLYRSGLAREALGRPVEAADLYRRFLLLWGEVDPPLPEVERARQRLEAIRRSR